MSTIWTLCIQYQFVSHINFSVIAMIIRFANFCCLISFAFHPNSVGESDDHIIKKFT